MNKSTILITTRNRASQLRLALESIRMKNYQDVDILVIDDASTEETASVLRGYGRFVRTERIERPGGYRHNPAAVLNVGHLLAKTDVVIEQCGEVCHLTNCVEPLMKVCQPGRMAVARVYCGTPDQMRRLQIKIDEGSYNFPEDFELDVCSNRTGTLKVPYLGEDSIALYTGWERPAPFLFLGAIHRKDFEAVKGYDEKLSRAADDDLANRLQNKGVRFCFVGRAVAFHLQHGKS